MMMMIRVKYSDAYKSIYPIQWEYWQMSFSMINY